MVTSRCALDAALVHDVDDLSPDHARRSFFVRSRRQAHAHPHRAILLSAGPLWRAYQHNHNHLWPRTTFSMGGQAAGQERGRHRQRIPHATCDLRARLAQRRLRLGAHRAAGPQHPFGHSIVASMLPLPCLARHAALHLAAPCYTGAAPLYCALFRTPRKPNARPAHLAAFACIVCVCVLGVCRSICFLLSFGSAVVCYVIASAFCWFGRVLHSLSVSVSGARVVCCSPSRLCMLCCVLFRFHHPPLILAHMQVWVSILFIVYLGYTFGCFDQVYPMYPKL